MQARGWARPAKVAALAAIATTADMSLGLLGVDLDQAIHELATLQ
jgi:hypothetical protein